MDTLYKYNLDVDFLNSYNFRKGNYKQAFNDFEYITKSFSNHAIGHHHDSLAAYKLRLSDKAHYHTLEEKNNVKWK
ncbi:MAG: hypothetical protein CL723_01785 [Chloroflexi bacterium]|jgi:hypothetical protein|nr:hypothetical protein [Chloroflexota bacterium]|tara:strand:- start:608 stop:835 length:228 start_codon:yes stop_codon:yes gene_type:complete